MNTARKTYTETIVIFGFIADNEEDACERAKKHIRKTHPWALFLAVGVVETSTMGDYHVECEYQ
jgi:hypothetical protein